MYKRDQYLEKIMPFIDKPVIKIITGMRRVGKSCLLKILKEHLKSKHTDSNHILYINKESLEFDFIKNYEDLYKYVQKYFNKVAGQKYLFIDEVQEIVKWEKAITSFFSDQNIDLYLTGSNAHLLSSELATLLSGRYIEIPVYSLSFKEFLSFRKDKKTSLENEFSLYIKYGGFPALHFFELKEEIVYQYINSIYDTIILKDVIQKNKIRNVSLLKNLTQYVFNNIGNIFSAKKISDYLKSQNLRIGIETIQNYLSYLESTFAIHKVPRYDIKGKRILEFHEKYYLGETGLQNALFGYKESNISGVLENIVFLELKRKGYRVYIGKFDNKEIDFIAEKDREKLYIQVTYLLSSTETVKREFSVLQKVKDNYPKFVISMDTIFGNDFEGIRRINLIDFLNNDYI